MEKPIVTKIPPIAHFIWAGGLKLLPPEGIENICQWINSNKNIEKFQAWLWVDIKTAPKEMIENYKEFFKQKGITVFTEQEAKNMDLTKISTPPVILKDIGAEENKLRNEFVAYEIDKLRPNYGSSSDLLRYEILFKFGGFYCDCTDVKPGKDNLAVILSQEHSDNVMYLEHCPQQPEAEQQKLEIFHINELGNDTFATNKGNQAALKMVIFARKNYDLPENLSLIHIMTAHSGNNIKDITVSRTGPGLVRQVLLDEDIMACKEVNGVLVDKAGKNKIYRFRDGKLIIATPGSNTGNWLNTRITKYDNPEDALERVKKTIIFEAKHFKILRLDDHVSDLIVSTNDKIKTPDALKHLEQVIQENFKNIKYTQLTGNSVQTILYASKNKLLNIFELSIEGVIPAINAQCYLNDFLKIEQTAIILKEQLEQQAQDQGLSIESLILRSQRPEVILNLYQQLMLGIEFIDHFSNFFKTYAENNSEQDTQGLKEYLFNRVQKYQEYANILNKLAEQEYKINLTKIDDLLNKIKSELNVEVKTEQKTPLKKY